QILAEQVAQNLSSEEAMMLDLLLGKALR
ncbi:MarR family transcriptional regulator, partial [Vibrio cholerae]|nr:MarR family transcriptional regulator [Vibrio cholerae]